MNLHTFKDPTICLHCNMSDSLKVQFVKFSDHKPSMWRRRRERNCFVSQKYFRPEYQYLKHLLIFSDLINELTDVGANKT